MDYEIDLQTIQISGYKDILKKQKLMASRRILKENIDDIFEQLAKSGITNVAELTEAINDSPKAEELAAQTGIPWEYLMILSREISGLILKPVLIADFPYVLPETFKILGECCIQSSKDFFELSNGGSDLKGVCAKTGISEEAALELGSMCDLIRINGVGPIFARILFEAGITSVNKFATMDAETIYNKVTEINEVKKYTRVMLEKNEIQLCLDFAKLITRH
jgi:hypothetical protein